jgi:hypothetical protein
VALDCQFLTEGFGGLVVQDKKHCPFYIKTGVCRFGVRCSRVHPVFNDKAVTLLIRSMYTGPGLAWDHQDGLEVCVLLSYFSHLLATNVF